jgi:hypothetical protein
VNRDKVIELAKLAGFHFFDAGHAPILHTVKAEYSERCFERFAELVAFNEREACLAEVEQGIWFDKTTEEILDSIASAIRARETK